jgi:drug/metabolite transporter (DMT)-like permease
MFALTLVFICVLGASIGQISMKSGMNQIGEIGSLGQLFKFDTLFHIFTNPRVLVGILFYGISGILWLGALSTLNVSFMYPFMSLAYVITAIAAFIFLKENITLLHWAGILMVVGGCFLIAVQAK